MDLRLIFLMGLTLGGLTCMALQGGLLASVIAAQSKEKITNKSTPLFLQPAVLATSLFLGSKLIAYTILGFLLGSFGQAFALSDQAKVILQIAAGIYILAVAANLLDLHPIFRYVVPQPPRFLSRLVYKSSKDKHWFAPALLGIMTVLIPCGTTLAVEFLAISSGNPWMGAAIMAVFTLGTMPLFFGLGLLTVFLGQILRKSFVNIAAMVLIYLSLTTLNGALVLAGAPLSLNKLAEFSPIEINLSGEEQNVAGVEIEEGVQVVSIEVKPSGYSPSYIKLKAGIPARLSLKTSGGLGCTNQFRIPQLGIIKNLPLSGEEVVEFTPTQKGKLTWTCSMGMFSGEIEVI